MTSDLVATRQTGLTTMDELFRLYSPHVWFAPGEPDMPTDFQELARIANHYHANGTIIPPEQSYMDLARTILAIDPKRVRDVQLGVQLLCRTSGVWTSSMVPEQFVDLAYIYTFARNGTLASHLFDTEYIIVRLRRPHPTKSWMLASAYGSAHGNGMWSDRRHLTIDDDTHVVYWSAYGSHAMYSTPGTKKRIFGFGNDACASGKQWRPTQLIILGQSAAAYAIDATTGSRLAAVDTTGMEFPGKIGALAGNNQPWPGAPSQASQYDGTRVDGWYKYQGGLANLFHGPKQKIGRTVRVLALVSCCCVWVIGPAVACWLHTYGKPSTVIMKQAILIILFFGIMLLTGAYLGLEMFVLNPVHES